MRCPVCEADNLNDAVECSSCGRSIAEGAGDADAGTLEGLEPTHLASADLDVDVAMLPGVEPTRLEEDPTAPPQWTAGPLALEHTEHEAVAGATAAWTSDLEIDSGREPDDGERTGAPTEAAGCPWCGTASVGAVCDNCGRRKSRYTTPGPQRQSSASGETVMCPACFARVADDVRCSDCGTPFPLREL
jgi:hypothetical protein